MGTKPNIRERIIDRRGRLDLEMVLAKLHWEHELLTDAIEKLEQLPSRRKRGPGRPPAWPWSRG
jgi:hypothetical protein